MKNRIIAVDDERGAGALLRLVLPEYEVQVEPDCCAALLAALDRPPELFLLDIMVPGITGKEFAERLEHSERLRHIPIIFVSASVHTGSDGEPIMVDGRPAFGKPFELAVLKRHIAEQLAAHSARASMLSSATTGAN
jgi:putative two-component system response regulator